MSFRKEEGYLREILTLGTWDGEVIRLSLSGEVLMRRQELGGDIGNPCTMTHLDWHSGKLFKTQII